MAMAASAAVAGCVVAPKLLAGSSSSSSRAAAGGMVSFVGLRGSGSVQVSLQKSKKKAGGVSSMSPVIVAAAATVVEEAAPPAVTTEALPRPTKIGKGIVRLRLTRLGRKKRPFYRIVATHCSWRRDGKYIELLGHYNPLHAKDDLGIVVKADRIKYWLGVGAQPSDTVTGILHKVGILKKAEVEQ